jgi:hypothetical protein
VYAVETSQALPEHDEKLSGDQIDIKLFGSSGPRYWGDKNYAANINKLISELKADPNKHAVILGFYKTSRSILRKNIDALKALLAKNGVSKSRYSVESHRWRKELSPDPLGNHPLYPVLFVIGKL